MAAREQTTDEHGAVADMLIQAFQHFNERTAQLKQSYRRLEQRIRELKRELEWKNHQLAEHLREKEALEEQVQRTNRLAAMGEMAASIAHEVRNPLGSIELFAALLKQELEQDGGKRTLVEHILSGVKSLNRTISNMLLFTKSLAARFEPVDPHQVLEASLVFASHVLRHHRLRLQKSFGADGVTVCADPELLKQVFLNLILNAIQAMPEGGTLTLATRLDQHVLEVKVGDTGVGMSAEVTEKIFNPFFSTKDGGTGLGLTIVHNIVEAHNGVIHVVSTRGKGTTFTILLPLDPVRGGLSRWEAYAVTQGGASGTEG
ncbi:MAG: hypothetical protein HYZ81_15460 [Nitrospinae bacterium]|nr:hypothetical protein [Nitrospinota bacterium]